MPTRKQKRREAKTRRHDYEYVYVDEQGREVELVEPPKPAKPERTTTNGAKPVAKAGAQKQAGPVKDARGRTLRPAKPPEWRRSAQRAAVFVLILFLFTSVVGKHKPPIGARVAIAVVYGAIAIPFFYWMDRAAYRRYAKAAGIADVTQRDKKKT